MRVNGENEDFMKKSEFLKDIIALSKSQGIITFDDINETLPLESISQGEWESLLDLLENMGVTVVFDPDTKEEESDVVESEEPEAPERTENFVRMYFHSMGNIPVLTRDKEREFAQRISKGSRMIEQAVKKFPFHKELKTSFQRNPKEGANGSKRNGLDGVVNRSLEILDENMESLKIIERSSKKGILQGRPFNKERATLEKQIGMKIDDFKDLYEKISRVRRLVRESKEALIIHNLRLVINIAKYYIGRGLSFLDLIQEGNIGLMKAVDKFDYTKGFKFSTYATWWIKQYIYRAIMDQVKTIRVPLHIMDQYHHISKISREFVSDLGREPSVHEIAEKIGMSAKRVEEILMSVQDTVSLQTVIGDDETVLEEFISDNNELSPYSYIETNVISDQTAKILKTLTPREEKVIRMRFGIGLDRNYTLEEIGKQLSVTRERVRQIEVRAMRKLKHPNRSRLLKCLHSA
jgi:RNA polymerase primary sigma factor